MPGIPDTIEELIAAHTGLEVSRKTLIQHRAGHRRWRWWCDLVITETAEKTFYEIKWRYANGKSGSERPLCESDAVLIFLDRCKMLKGATSDDADRT
jgi:hypothetical protein